MGALPRRDGPLRGAQPRCGEPGQGARARQHLVRRGGRERRVPARRPLGARDPEHRAAAAQRAAGSLRVLPRHRARPGVAGSRHARSFVRDRSSRRHPGRGGRGCAVRHRDAFRRSCAVRQGQPAPLPEQLPRQRGAEGGGERRRADRRETHPLRLVREDLAGTRPHGRHAVALPRRREGRRGGDQDAARRVRDRGLGPLRRAPRGRAADCRLPWDRRRTASAAARSTGSRSTSAATRISTWSARRN